MKKAVWVAVAVLLLGFSALIIHTFRPKIRIDERSDHWLPSTATNICSFYRAFWPYRALECNIPERDFEEFSKSQSWKLEEISDPIEILRFLNAMRVSKIEIPKKYENESSVARIEKGTYFHGEVNPSGGYTLVAFDRDTGRAFFYFGGR